MAPPEYRTPGVYVEESSFGPRAIEPAATSVTAFVGRAARGPVEQPVQIDSWRDFQRTFGGRWAGGELGHAVHAFFENGGSRAVVVRVARKARRAVFRIQLPDGARVSARARNPGAWANALQFSPAQDPDGATVLEIADPATGESERHSRAAFDPEGSALVRFFDARRARGGGGGGLQVETITAGDDGLPLDANALIGGQRRERRRGLYALLRAEGFQLLCLPPCERVTRLAPELLDAAAELCAERRAFFIMDPPEDWRDADDALAGSPTYGPRSAHAALYFPRLRIADPLQDNTLVAQAPCGAIAGVFARTDATRGVWKAPAGTEATLLGVDGLTAAVNDAQQELLNPEGVNALREFTGRGRLVWGARTRSQDPEWKYVSVRRFFNFVEQSLYDGTQWVVFEPNNDVLWTKVRTLISDFLNSIWRRGALQGQKAEDAFFVQCDRSTMTQNDLDNGRMICEIGLAVVRPAEFVIFRIGQKTADSRD